LGLIDSQAAILSSYGISISTLTIFSVLSFVCTPTSALIQKIIFKKSLKTNHYIGIGLSFIGVIISSLSDFY